MKRKRLTQILDTIKSQSLDQLSVKDELALPMEAYNRYKTSYVENVQFDSYVDTLGNLHSCKYDNENIAKGTTDPGVDYFNQ